MRKESFKIRLLIVLVLPLLLLPKLHSVVAQGGSVVASRANDLTNGEITDFIAAMLVDLRGRPRGRMPRHAKRLIDDVESLILELQGENSRRSVQELTHQIAATAVMINHERTRDETPIRLEQ